MSAAVFRTCAAVLVVMLMPMSKGDFTDDYNCSCFNPDRCVVDRNCSIRNKPQTRCYGGIRREFHSAVSQCITGCLRLQNRCHCLCQTYARRRCWQSWHRVCIRSVFRDTVTHSDDRVSTASRTSSTNTSSLAIGLPVAGLLLLALIVAFLVLYRQRRKLAQRISILGFLRTSTSSPDDASNYETLSPAAVPTYEEIQSADCRLTSSVNSDNQYELEAAISEPPSSPPSSASASAAASVPAMNAAVDESSTYNDTSTTLVDNALYDDVQQPAVTSSNDDVTDLTLIDNDLYEREGQGQGQQNVECADYE